MGARRDDISREQRAQIAIEVMAEKRAWGKVSELAQSYQVTRKTIYEMAQKGKAVLEAGLKPRPPGPQVQEKMIKVDRNRLVRGSVVLTEVGVSQRDVVMCLEEMLDTRRSVGWVNGELGQVEQAATAVNESWQPALEETLSGDEIYANGQPNLLVVGNGSLYIYALSRQPACDGETWGCLLLAGPECPLFASDAGTGLQAGVSLAGIEGHQLDWDHLLRPLWGQVARLEQQAYAVLSQLEARTLKFEHATTEKRLHNHLKQWEKLNQEVIEKIERFDAFERIARQVDNCFALIDWQTGHLQDTTTAIKQLQGLGQQLQSWSGRIYHKLSTNLTNWAPALFSYQPVLQQALLPLQQRYGQPALAALSALWQIEANLNRRPLSLIQRQAYLSLWDHHFDQALSCLAPDLFWAAWDELSLVLGRSWRGSMLAECVNSLLRPILDARKQTDQGCLDLFRFFHNVRPFQRGKRAGSSPAELVGLDVPDDPLLLLGLKPKVFI